MSIVGWLGRRFPPSDALTAEESAIGLRWWRRSGLGIQMMDTLSVGAFLTAFALELGASNLYIGVLAAMPHLAQIGQIPGVYLADRWRNRRASSVLFTALSRPMYLLMAAAAFVPAQSAALALLMFAFALRYATTSLIVSQLVKVSVLRHWGAIADRLSNKAMLQVCAPLFVACMFAWTFTTFPEPHALTLPLLVAIHVLTGLATAGVMLASGNIAMKLAPRGDATAYLASNSLVISVASGVAPVVGGLLADFFEERRLSISLHWRSPGGGLDVDTVSIAQWEFFFALAALLGVVALTRLARVREVGHVEEGVVLAEVYLEARRLVQNLSSIAGLRQASEFPFEQFERDAGAREDGRGR